MDELISNFQALCDDPFIVDEIHFLHPSSEIEQLVVSESKLGIPLPTVKAAVKSLYAPSLNLTNIFKDHENRLVLLGLPHISTLWGRRKSALLDRRLNCLNEMNFLNHLAGIHPKSPELYHHCYWMIRNFREEESFNDWSNMALKLARLGAEKYPNNYYAWTFRQRVIELGNLNIKIVDDELKFIRKWREVHISDHSCFHYSQFILLKIRSLVSDRFGVELSYELKDITELISLYDNHEALWYHRRWVITHLREEMETSDEAMLLVHEELGRFNISIDSKPTSKSNTIRPGELKDHCTRYKLFVELFVASGCPS